MPRFVSCLKEKTLVTVLRTSVQRTLTVTTCRTKNLTGVNVTSVGKGVPVTSDLLAVPAVTRVLLLVSLGL